MEHSANEVAAIENKNMKQKKVKILFVCVENARRSQMAAGFAEALGKEEVEIYSAGSHPASQIDPLVIEVMKEKGISTAELAEKAGISLPTAYNIQRPGLLQLNLTVFAKICEALNVEPGSLFVMEETR
jgi:DNA-binding Xre family transcriptional regulator